MLAGPANRHTKGGKWVPATPGTMANASPRHAGSSMCAQGAGVTIRDRCAAAVSWPRRVVADKQVVETIEASPGQ